MIHDARLTEEILGASQFELITSLSKLATQLGQRLFLVGGGVRDLLLRRAVTDFDLMIDGQLLEFLALCEREWGTLFPSEPTIEGITKFEHYFTAKIRFASPFRGHLQLDFSQTRKETYPQPGRKPTVQAGSLEEDVRRRDFTLNSLCLEIGGVHLSLVDLCGGKADLDSKHLRVHHEQSFVDDPIRLVRAVRFQTRFGFGLESTTSRLFAAALQQHLLNAVPAQRRFDELRKVLSEVDPAPILARLDELGVLLNLCPYLDARAAQKLPSAPLSWEERLCILTASAPREELTRFFAEVQLAKSVRERLLK